jgi:hypothetical protein
VFIRKGMAWAAVITVALWFALKPAQGQEDQKQAEKPATSTTSESKLNPEQADKPVHTYRVDFSLNELEDGKKINTRHYSMNVNTGDRNQVKISTSARVPDEPSTTSESPTKPDFLNVTIHIYCRVQEHGDEVLLSVEGVIDNVLNPPNGRPVTRDIDIVGSTVATPGKPIVIGSVDDPSSNREFQLEATLTKVR